MEINKKRIEFIYILILYSLIYVAVYFILGIYFEDYESLTNYYFKFSAYKGILPYEIHNENFLLNPIFFYCYRIFPSFPFYDIFKCLTNILGLSIIHYLLIKKTPLYFKYVITIVLLLFFIDNIILVYNVRTAGILTIGAILFIQSKENFSSTDYVKIFAILVLAFFSRIEIPLILLVLYGIVYFIFNNKLRSVLTVSIVFGIAINALYLLLSLSNIDGQNDFNKYERALFDMNNSVVSNYDMTKISEFDKNQIVNISKALFIKDKEVDKIELESIINYHKLKDYIFTNNDFKKQYVDTLNIMATQAYSQFKYLILSVAFLSFFLVLKHKLPIIKIMAVISLLFGTIAFMNIFAEIQIGFISIYLLSAFCLIIYVAKMRRMEDAFLILIFVGLLNVYNFISTSIVELSTINKSNHFLVKENEKLKEKGQEVYLGSINTDNAYPNKLFTNLNFHWNYLDVSSMHSIPVFKEYLKDEYGQDWERLDKRMDKIIEQNASIAMSEMYMDIYSRYLELVYNYSIEFENISDIPYSEVRIYKPSKK